RAAAGSFPTKGYGAPWPRSTRSTSRAGPSRSTAKTSASAAAEGGTPPRVGAPARGGARELAARRRPRLGLLERPHRRLGLRALAHGEHLPQPRLHELLLLVLEHRLPASLAGFRRPLLDAPVVHAAGVAPGRGPLFRLGIHRGAGRGPPPPRL